MQEQQQPFSYDEVPYRSLPYPQSQPDRLATLATLFGISPAPPKRARVLELGCAGGGNLVAMAEMLPQSQFVGVDLSARQLEDAKALVDGLDLENVELLHRDLADLDASLGEFDYIIAHGLFSWVGPDRQAKILEICRQCLASNGVAYISYNTYPGWKMRGMIRDMICYHTDEITEPRQRVSQARALLRFLTQSVSRENNAFAAYLREELELFGHLEDYYLYHEHLEAINEPLYFWQFVERAGSHDLQFLCEADFRTMIAGNLSKRVEDTLRRITRDIVQMEQYMDFVRNRMFRQTLLCHRNCRLDRDLKPAVLESLYVSSPLKPEGAEVEVCTRQPARFVGSKVSLETADPLTKSALIHLAKIWPSWTPFRSLLMASRSLLHPEAVQDAARIEADAKLLGERLLQCYSSGAVELHSVPPPFVTSVSGRPVVSPLARIQAQDGCLVTNRRGENVSLTDLSRRAIQHLNGEIGRDELVDRLMEAVAREELVIQEAGRPVTDPKRTRKMLESTLEASLNDLARAALLVG